MTKQQQPIYQYLQKNGTQDIANVLGLPSDTSIECLAKQLKVIEFTIEINIFAELIKWHQAYRQYGKALGYVDIIALALPNLQGLSLPLDLPGDVGVTIAYFDHYTAFADAWHDYDIWEFGWRKDMVSLFEVFGQATNTFFKSLRANTAKSKLHKYFAHVKLQVPDLLASLTSGLSIQQLEVIPAYFEQLSKKVTNSHPFHEKGYSYLLAHPRPNWQDCFTGSFTGYNYHGLETNTIYHAFIHRIKEKNILWGAELARLDIRKFNIQNRQPVITYDARYQGNGLLLLIYTIGNKQDLFAGL